MEYGKNFTDMSVSYVHEYKKKTSEMYFTLNMLASNMDYDNNLCLSIKRDGGIYFANVFKNIFENMFSIADFSGIKKDFLLLESEHTLAKVIRRNFKDMFLDYAYESIPIFLLQGDIEYISKQINIIHNLLPSNKIVKKSIIKHWLKVIKLRKESYANDNNDISFMKRKYFTSWEKTAKPYIEIIIGKELPEFVTVDTLKTKYKLKNKETGNEIFSIGYGKYCLTKITFPDKTSYPAEKYALVGKSAANKIRKALLADVPD